MLTGASRSSCRPDRSLSPDSGSGKDGPLTSMDVDVGSGNARGMARGLFPAEGSAGNSVVPKVGASDMWAASPRLDGPAELEPEVVLVRARWALFS